MMKRWMVLGGVIILVAVLSFAFGKGVGAEETALPETTRIVIQTSGALAYEHKYYSDPPRIVLRFFQESVYGHFQESTPIQKGVVDRIEASYFRKNPLPGAKRPLKMLTFHLLADTPYEVLEGPRSIFLVIHHPREMAKGELAKGKVILGALSAPVPPKAPATSFSQEVLGEEALAEAFQKANAKMIAKVSSTPQAVLSPTPRFERSFFPRSSPTPTGPLATAQEPRPSRPLPEPSPFFPLPKMGRFVSWQIPSSFILGLLLFFILGGLVWPPSWFSVQNLALKREKQKSWDMARKIIALKEEAVAREEEHSEKTAVYEERSQSLQSQVERNKEDALKLHEEAKTLFTEREALKKELDRHTADLHELARERIEMADRLDAIQAELNEKSAREESMLKELHELSARHDQEILHRRELEAMLEEGRHKKEPPSGAIGEEKRRWTRCPVGPTEKKGPPMTVEVQGPAGRLIYGYPRNVSLGGVSFDLKENVELPESFSLTLFFPNRKSGVETEGKVIWKIQEGQCSRYGIRFVELSQNGNDLISQFIKERFPQMREAAQAIQESLDQKHAGRTVTFGLSAPHAQSVSVAGDFNGWDPQMHLLKRMKDGTWKAILLLPAGTYQYQFYVDGIWQVDPEAKIRVSNPFGGENAVVDVS